MKGAILCLSFVGVLLLATIFFLTLEMYSGKTQPLEEMISFEKMIGGLGMGAAMAPTWNYIDYDPRIQPVDDSISWPIPGGYSYSPHRTTKVSCFEEIPQDHLALGGPRD